MPRLSADFRISLKRRGGKTHRIELVRNPLNQRFWVRRNGKQSPKLPVVTARPSSTVQGAGGREQGVGGGRWAVGSGRWAVGGGQWAVDSGWWAVGGGQSTVASEGTKEQGTEREAGSRGQGRVGREQPLECQLPDFS